jgi:SET domain-containing protein
MGSYVSPKLAKKKSNAGYGLFAIEPIAKGERVVDYSGSPGTWMHTKEADALYEQGNDYILQTDDDLYFVASNDDELEDADLINHSCEPNCGIRGSLEIVALRDIQPGEEITFDYAMSESSDFRMRCACGASSCRGVVTGEDWKIPELQKKYAGYFSDYLQRKIDRSR